MRPFGGNDLRRGNRPYEPRPAYLRKIASEIFLEDQPREPAANVLNLTE